MRSALLLTFYCDSRSIALVGRVASECTGLRQMAAATSDVPAEDVRPVPNFPFVQIIFRLPENLPIGICTVRVTVHGQMSNLGTFKVRV